MAGRVDIGGATLDLRLSPDDAAAWQPQAGPFVLISKQGRGAVSPACASALLFMDASVNSTGGDGNDVTLNLTRNSRQAGSPPAPTISGPWRWASTPCRKPMRFGAPSC